MPHIQVLAPLALWLGASAAQAVEFEAEVAQAGVRGDPPGVLLGALALAALIWIGCSGLRRS